MKILGIFPFFMLLVGGANSQDTIFLANPSFGRIPAPNTVPEYWTNCGFSYETLPDLHPQVIGGGFYGVSKGAKDGGIYLGMIVRENGTWNLVGQELSQKMEAGKSYRFSLEACRSLIYEGKGFLQKNKIQYTDPVIIRLWGGHSLCERREMLSASPPVKNTHWNKYTFYLQPKEQYDFFIIEAYFETSQDWDYNGNVLIDDLSPIIEIEENLIVDSTIVQNSSSYKESFYDLIDLYWEEIIFSSFEPRLQQGSADLLTIIASDFPINETEKLVVLLANGTGELREERLQHLEKVLFRSGLPKNSIRVAPVKNSDFYRDWLAKNDYLWIGID